MSHEEEPRPEEESSEEVVVDPIEEEDPPVEPDLAPAMLDDDDVVTIRDDMLHRERIDLEAGMSVFPRVTIAIMAVCVVVFVRQLMVGSLDDRERIIETGAVQRDAVLGGEVWRLISGGFMHASVDHLVGNMVMLFVLGMACEHAFGWGSFLFLYTACCVTGSLLTLFTDVPTVGASGAIFGLGGAVIALAVANRDKIELRDHRVGIVLAVWSAYTLLLGLLNPNISNSCHLGGLLGGLALGAALPLAILADRREHARSGLTRLQAAIAFAALASTSLYFLPRLR